MIRLIDERIMEKLRDKTTEIDLEELVPLVVEWRAGRVSKAKCPYCVKPIEKQATKCNHCMSEIEWFKFNGLYGPCKAGEAEEMERTLILARATYQASIAGKRAAAEGERAALKEERENKITELKDAVCSKCSKPVFASWEFEQASLKRLKKLEERRRRYSSANEFKCKRCSSKGCLLFLLIIGLLIFLARLG